MTKQAMAAKLAKKTGISVSKAGEVLSAIFDAQPGKGILAVELDAGRKVTIPGFGTFGCRTREARMGRNPATGQALQIPQKTYVFFRPGKTLRERVEV